MPPAEQDTTSRRAERLRILLDLAHQDGAVTLTLDADLGGDAGAREAVALANACLSVERALRRRQWRDLERLLALVPPCGGELRDVLHLPGTEGLCALRTAHGLGWLGIAPEDHE